MWFPDGLRVPPDPDETAPHDPDNGDTGRFSLHGQTTLIAQGVPGFRSPYAGAQSLIPHQARQTTTATIFLGLKLTDSTEIYYNPEFSQGFGLSRTLGVAGFVNGEAQKAGAPFPKLRSNRYYVKQTFGLGGETVDVPDGPNQVATRYDAERITLIAGKFALGDFFDGNVYAHDPRVDFFNWSLWGSSAWDFPANLPGFTQGVYAEYNRPEFAIRAAYTQVPKEPSSDVLDPRVFRRAGLNAEFEQRYVLPGLDQPGKLRIGLFSNVGVSANNREVVTLTQLGAVRRHQRRGRGDPAPPPQDRRLHQPGAGADARTRPVRPRQPERRAHGEHLVHRHRPELLRRPVAQGQGLGPAGRHGRDRRGDERALALAPRRLRGGLFRAADRRRAAQLRHRAGAGDLLRPEPHQVRDPDLRLPVHRQPRLQPRPRAGALLRLAAARGFLTGRGQSATSGPAHASPRR